MTAFQSCAQSHYGVFGHLVTTHFHACSGILWRNTFSRFFFFFQSYRDNTCVDALSCSVTKSIFSHFVATRMFTHCDETHFHALSGMGWKHVRSCLFTRAQLCCEERHLNAFSGIWWQHLRSPMLLRNAFSSIFSHMVTTWRVHKC